MGRLQNLKKRLNEWVDITLAELCSAYIKQLAKQTTKKRNNSLSTQCLQNNLTTEHRSTTIETSTQDTSEKIIMELDKTDEVVAHVREWSIDRIDNTNHENAEAIYEEFEEWIDLDDEDSHLDILTLEPLEDDKS